MHIVILDDNRQAVYVVFQVFYVINSLKIANKLET